MLKCLNLNEWNLSESTDHTLGKESAGQNAAPCNALCRMPVSITLFIILLMHCCTQTRCTNTTGQKNDLWSSKWKLKHIAFYVREYLVRT